MRGRERHNLQPAPSLPSVPAVLLILCLCLWIAPAWAADPLAPPGAYPQGGADHAFQPLDGARPFPPEILTEVLFDRVGFLWIGTREGLYLHDGQRFRKFQHEVQNPGSISSNGIRGVFEDSHQRLWINTISGGLNLLDRATWQFRSWRHQRNDPQSLIHDGVFALAEAPGGRLWVGTQAGLDLFDPATGEFARTPLATGGEFIIALLIDRDGRLWVATLGQGLFRQRADHSGFEPVPFARAPPQLDVFSLAEDRAGEMWVGTRFGLYRVDAQSDRLVAADTGRIAGKPITNVTALLPAPDGGVWVGTFGSGLFWKAAAAEQLQPVPLGPEGPGALHIDSGALAFAPDGRLFVGTFGAGLMRASPQLAGLRTWRERTSADDRAGLSAQDVYALQALPAREGSGEHLLVGSFGGGIDEIDVAQGTVTHAPLPASDEIDARLSGTTDLMRTRAGVLWATTNEGVFRWDRRSGRFHPYLADEEAAASGLPGYSFALLEDRAGRIWVGSAGTGLYLYRPERDGFVNFRPVAGKRDSLPDDFVTVLLEDRRGRLWVGTRSGGIGVCRLAQELRCETIAAGRGPTQVSHDHITSLLEAPNGSIWAGSAGGGLNRLNLDADGRVAGVERWTRDQGLVDDDVMALVYAPDGALWLSTHGGLSRLDAQTGRLANLTTADGLPTTAFNPKAALLLGGRLYFGSAKGVVAIDPLDLPARGTPPRTVIEAVSGLDAAHLPTRPMWQLDTLRVPWRMPFSLQLAVLGYGGGQPHFQYRMDAAEPWTNLGEHGQLTLHALAAGEHRLEVRARLGGHDWTLARPLRLEVVPPWWRSTAVQASAAMLALFALLAAFWWRVHELELRNRELQRVHGLREQALAEVQDSERRLGEAFATLRRMTMRLEAAKEKERTHLARELHDEFGQALTTIKINLGLALQQAPSANSRARVGDTIGVIDRLIGQVRALSLDLRPPLLDEMGLLPALEAHLEAVADRAGLRLELELDPRLAQARSDHDMTVFRIVQEALTNVVRHAQARVVEIRVAAVGGGIRIRVRDDGDGFDVDAVLARASSGEGLGLFGMRERVHDLGGEWRVHSLPGRGTEIEVTLPVEAPPES